MLIAHLADLHLGYRAYYRAAPGGMNLRERDVARAFTAAIEQVVDLTPDLVLIAGDLFHSVRPPNSAIADAFRQLVHLRTALPTAPVVIIAGNHDAPRSAESGSILQLFAEITGVHVVEGESRPVYLEPLDASVLCVPHAAVREGVTELEPDGRARTNVLLLHGCITGDGVENRLRFLGDYGAATVDIGMIRPERWDYVALGHYHITTELRPNMWYAGATERTAPNIWEEAAEEKGFVSFDTISGRGSLHTVPTRPVIDLPRLNARAVGAEASAAGALYIEPAELDARIRAAVATVPGGIAEKVVRLVIEDVPRGLFRALDHRRIREFRAEALHFHLDVRRPHKLHLRGLLETRRRTLEEEVETFLRSDWRLSSGALDRERVIGLALEYLADAGPADDEALA
ncbi:MAG: metallophosphoesterase family protein [Longimicrobiales bacterium]